MKKISLVLLAFLLTSLTANAYIDNEYTKNGRFLKNIGYSDEMSGVITITTSDPYGEKIPGEGIPKIKQIMDRSLHYIVPGEYTYFDFYHHSINFDHWGWEDF